MKELRRNMRVVMAIIMVLFIGAGAWLGATVYTQGDTWASNVYNPRLVRTSSSRGDITDRDGTILATIGQQPEYHAEKALDILVDYLGMNIKPTRTCYYSTAEIRIKANLNE